MKTHQVDKLAGWVYELLRNGRDPYIIVDKEGEVHCTEFKGIESTDKIIIRPEKLRFWVETNRSVKVVEKMQYVINKYK